MRGYRPRLVLAAGLASLLITNVAAAGGRTFARAAASPHPAEPARTPVAPAVVPAAPASEGARAVTIFTDRALFQAANPGLPLEDFEEGDATAGIYLFCDAPVDATGDAPCGFAAGDILGGIAFQDNPGPEAAAMVLLGSGTCLNPTQALITNTYSDAFDIIFDPPVLAAGMDLHSTPDVGLGPPDVLSIQIYDASAVLIASDPAANASGPGNFWGVTSDTPIGRISMTSTNTWAEGVDNIEFGDPVPVELQSLTIE